MAAALGLLSYLRIPFYAASGIVAAASGALYYYQKSAAPSLFFLQHTDYHSELIYPRNIPGDARTTFLKPSSFRNLQCHYGCHLGSLSNPCLVLYRGRTAVSYGMACKEWSVVFDAGD